MILSPQERLASIIEMAYEIVCQKIAGGVIEIYNEASFQLHLGAILRTLGQLYECSLDENGVPERFIIELEKPLEIGITSKSKGKVRCDIVVGYVRGNKYLVQAFLELKYFKKPRQGSGSEATKDNRFGLFMDLENLEAYREHYNDGLCPPLCYLLAIAENETYANPKAKSSLKTGNGCWTIDSYRNRDNGQPAVLYVSHKPIVLKGNYMFSWKSFSHQQHCLIVRMQ